MFVIAVVLIAVAGRLESLVEFSFGPLRAKIERNLTESEILLEKLKKFAAIQARSANAASVHTGRFASGDDWIFQSVKRMENGLRELGADEAEIISARSDFVRLTIKDAGRAAMGGDTVPIKLGKIAEEEWRQIRRDGELSSPDIVESFLLKWEQLDDDHRMLVEDMRWMIENEDVRDVEQYMRAHTDLTWA